MVTPEYLRSLIDLTDCDCLDTLLSDAVTVLERELGLRAYIEVWDADGARVSRGATPCVNAAHCTWIGLRYTIGAIHVDPDPLASAPTELLARQLAPLVERLFDLDASRRRTIREDVKRLYERRIREVLIRCDWNASAVARELSVSRVRVAEVARGLKRSSQLSRSGTAHVRATTDDECEDR